MAGIADLAVPGSAYEVLAVVSELFAILNLVWVIGEFRCAGCRVKVRASTVAGAAYACKCIDRRDGTKESH